MLLKLGSRARWSLWRRLWLQHTIAGFYAKPFSFCDARCRFGEHVWLGNGTSLYNVSMGRFSYMNGGSAHNASIGHFCSIGQEVKIGGFGSHPFHISTHPTFYSASPPTRMSFHVVPGLDTYKQVLVGHDVWVGDRALILDGVSVGTGAVVGAGAIVTKDVEPYSVVVGSPARCIRTRVPPSHVGELLESRWWAWDDDRIRLAAHLIASEDLEAFLDYVRKSIWSDAQKQSP